MKIFAISLIVLAVVATSCKSGKTFTVYTIGPDSVFYQDVEKFNPNILIKGISTDKAFMDHLSKDISASRSKKVYKPIQINPEKEGQTSLNMSIFLRDNISDNITVAIVDTAEERYFANTSYVQELAGQRYSALPAGPIIVQAPHSESVNADMTVPVLMFLIEKNGNILYRYDAPANNGAYKKITPPSTEKVKVIMDELEQQQGFRLDTMEKRILVQSRWNDSVTAFRTIKNAFKEKQIYKFRLVTIAE